MKRIIILIIAAAVVIGAIFFVVQSIKNRKEKQQFEQSFTDNDTGEVTDLIRQLPQETDHYTVSYQSSNNSLLIVPKIPFSSAEGPRIQVERNWNLYVQYAKEATDWLKSQQVTPNDFPIEWWLQDWWPAGKSVGF